MAVVVETTLGDITIDLYTRERPKTCMNFLKLCKIKYYNYNLFHSVQHNFIAQTGDPTGSGHGGESIFGTLYGEQARYYAGEQMPKIKHTRAGLVSMVNCGDNMLGAQFFITLGSELSSLDNEHCVFGEVTEGEDVLLKLNEAICDEAHRPYQDIRITHTIILEDPFDDPPNLRVPERSPSPTPDRFMNGRLAPDEAIDEMQGKSIEEIEEMVQEKEAAARATILEIVGDLPDANMAPPENVLFVCKLNPVTNDDDLEIIFSRFGKINSCEVIRDKVTGDSLQYAFIEFADKKSCEDAYFKMDNVLIDDRRIHVDFSQSVAKVKWRGKGRGVDYFGGKPGEKVESERHRNDKFQDRQPKQNQMSLRRDDKRGGSRDFRRDELSRRNDHRRRDDNQRNRDRSLSRSRQESLNKQRYRSRDRDGSGSRTKDREGSDSRHRDREGSDSRHRDREGSDSRHRDRDRSGSRNKDRARSNRDKNKNVSRGRSRDRNRRYSKDREDRDRHRRRSKDRQDSKEKTHKDKERISDIIKQNHNDGKDSSEPETKKRKNSSEPDTRKRKNSSETETRKGKDTPDPEISKGKNSSESELRKRKNSSEPETRKRKNSSEPETRKRKNSSESETAKRKNSIEPEIRKRKNSSETENRKRKTSLESDIQKRKNSPQNEEIKIEKHDNSEISINACEINGNNKSEALINNQTVSSLVRDKAKPSSSTRSEKAKEILRNKDIEVSSKKRYRDSKTRSNSESSSESSSVSSSSSSEPRKRKKTKRKKVLVIKKKGRSGRHKKRRVETQSDSSSNSSETSSSESESEPRRSKHKKRKTKMEVVKIISRKPLHKKKKKKVVTSSSESSSSESDVPRKKKKSRKLSTSCYKNKDNVDKKKRKDKNKRKYPTESESSSSEGITFKKRKTSKKPSRKKQTSESEESTSD